MILENELRESRRTGDASRPGRLNDRLSLPSAAGSKKPAHFSVIPRLTAQKPRLDCGIRGVILAGLINLQ